MNRITFAAIALPAGLLAVTSDELVVWLSELPRYLDSGDWWAIAAIAVLTALFVTSEALADNPNAESNGVRQLLFRVAERLAKSYLSGRRNEK